jgi:primosomal replication protein N
LAGGAPSNRVTLSGIVSARETLRFTPAGIPVVTLTLDHQSTQEEATVPREVKATIDTVALGPLAQRMDAVQIGQSVRVSGFLANRSRRSSRVVLHVNEFEIEQED